MYKIYSVCERYKQVLGSLLKSLIKIQKKVPHQLKLQRAPWNSQVIHQLAFCILVQEQSSEADNHLLLK